MNPVEHSHWVSTSSVPPVTGPEATPNISRDEMDPTLYLSTCCRGSTKSRVSWHKDPKWVKSVRAPLVKMVCKAIAKVEAGEDLIEQEHRLLFRIQDHESVLRDAMELGCIVFTFASKRLQGDRRFVLDCLAQLKKLKQGDQATTVLFSKIDPELKKDPDVVFEFFMACPVLIARVDSSVLSEELAVKFISGRAGYFSYLSSRLKRNKVVILEGLNTRFNSWQVFCEISEKLQRDEDILLAAMRKDYFVCDKVHGKEGARSSEEDAICKRLQAQFKQECLEKALLNPHNMLFFPDEIFDPEFVDTVLKNHKGAYEHLPTNVQKREDILFIGLKYHINVFDLAFGEHVFRSQGEKDICSRVDNKWMNIGSDEKLVPAGEKRGREGGTEYIPPVTRSQTKKGKRRTLKKDVVKSSP